METKVKQFINNTNTSITFKFVGHKPHFIGDTEPRDVWKVTIQTDKAKEFIEFGQSLHNSNGKGTIRPTEYDVLSCLQKYEVGTYQDFLDEFGYNYSNETMKIYKAVKNEYEKVCNLWSDSEIEELTEIW